MVGYNRIMAIGNLGTDPEMRYTAQGTPMTTFRLAASRSYYNANGERQEETEWFTILTFRGLAEQCNQYLAKGRRAFVDGRLRSRNWTANDGQNRFVNEIVADNVRFLDPRDAGVAGGDGAAGQEEETSAEGVRTTDPDVRTTDPDELPF